MRRSLGASVLIAAVLAWSAAPAPAAVVLEALPLSLAPAPLAVAAAAASPASAPALGAAAAVSAPASALAAALSVEVGAAPAARSAPVEAPAARLIPRAARSAAAARAPESAGAFFDQGALGREIALSEVTPEELGLIQRRSQGVVAMRDFLPQENGRGHVLGLTGVTLDAVARAKGLETYEVSYDRLGVELGRDHTRRYLDALVQEALPVVFLVPRRLKTFFPAHLPGVTQSEFAMLLADPGRYLYNVTFVFGAYDFFSPEEEALLLARAAAALGVDPGTSDFRERYKLKRELVELKAARRRAAVTSWRP